MAKTGFRNPVAIEILDGVDRRCAINLPKRNGKSLIGRLTGQHWIWLAGQARGPIIVPPSLDRGHVISAWSAGPSYRYLSANRISRLNNYAPTCPRICIRIESVVGSVSPSADDNGVMYLRDVRVFPTAIIRLARAAFKSNSYELTNADSTFA